MSQHLTRKPQLAKQIHVTAFTNAGQTGHHKALLRLSCTSNWLTYKQASSTLRDAADICVVLEMSRICSIAPTATDIISVIHGGDKIYPTLVHQLNRDSNTNRCREYKTTKVGEWCREVLGPLSVKEYLAVQARVPQTKSERFIWSQ